MKNSLRADRDYIAGKAERNFPDKISKGLMKARDIHDGPLLVKVDGVEYTVKTDDSRIGLQIVDGQGKKVDWGLSYEEAADTLEGIVEEAGGNIAKVIKQLIKSGVAEV
jgi:hypothetical protein